MENKKGINDYKEDIRKTLGTLLNNEKESFEKEDQKFITTLSEIQTEALTSGNNAYLKLYNQASNTYNQVVNYKFDSFTKKENIENIIKKI